MFLAKPTAVPWQASVLSPAGSADDKRPGSEQVAARLRLSRLWNHPWIVGEGRSYVSRRALSSWIADEHCDQGQEELYAKGNLRQATMGRSRRERAVTLTKTRKHLVGRDSKQEVVEDLRSAVDKYASIYVFRTENMRNTLLKELRSTWADSRFFFGRKKVAQVALGRTEAEEHAEGLRQVSEQLAGNVGLLLTNRAHADVVKFFSEYERADVARGGFEATEAVELAEGELDMFESAQVAALRALGMPVALRKGRVCLERPLTVCEAGQRLTPEQAKMLELLGVRMATFRVVLLSYYRKEGGLFEMLSVDAERE